MCCRHGVRGECSRSRSHSPNLDLLLEQPPAEPAPWIPKIEQDDVFWVKNRNMVRCSWWDSKKSTMRLKSIGVELGTDMDDEAKLDAVTSAATELQEFFDTHHNLGDNMPRSKRCRASSDEMSAEAAPGEPVQEDSKTDGAETERDETE